ncbi:MAG TPA: magnesium chelatase domain-containing protein, partial [Solirubrobacteraceae bacterium]|nr:magnesium chelatase domain-containing protein [Solirubrobacteraceae bacterium]
MLVCAHAFAIDRGAAAHVDIELDLRAGLPGLAVIGLGASTARDLRERVQAAVLNSGYGFPRRRVTVNVAPAPRRCGSELDLAVACCVLAVAGQLDRWRLERVGLCAELG